MAMNQAMLRIVWLIVRKSIVAKPMQIAIRIAPLRVVDTSATLMLEIVRHGACLFIFYMVNLKHWLRAYFPSPAPMHIDFCSQTSSAFKGDMGYPIPEVDIFVG
jgi:hypothetical protein